MCGGKGKSDNRRRPALGSSEASLELCWGHKPESACGEKRSIPVHKGYRVLNKSESIVHVSISGTCIYIYTYSNQYEYITTRRPCELGKEWRGQMLGPSRPVWD